MNAAISAPAVKVVRSVQEQVSPEEWQSRGQSGGMLPSHRDVWHDRDDRQPYLMPRAGHG